MLTSLPLLLSCVSATAIPLARRDDIDDPFNQFPDGNSSPFGPDFSNAISNSIDNTIDIPYFNGTQILTDIENSINSQLQDLNQDLEDLDPFDLFHVIDQAIEGLPSYVNQFKDDLVQEIETAISNPDGSFPNKRDTLPIASDISSTIASAVNDIISLPSANKTQIVQDIENSVTSDLGNLGQGLEILDPLNIFGIIEKAVNNLPSEVNQFKNTLIQRLQAAFGGLPGIQIPNLQ